MSTINKKLQDMSRNRSRKYCKVTFTFTSDKYWKLRHLFCFKARKTCIRSTMGNNRLHALILVHKFSLLIEKTAAKRHSDIFLRIIHNICKIKLTRRYFSNIYISYQMYKSWSCVTFYHSWNKFPQPNDNRIDLFPDSCFLTLGIP